MKTPTETERKFIIRKPEKSLLDALPHSEITQTYLLGDAGVTERVRMRVYEDGTCYTHTRKVRISKMSSFEDEREIGQAEYARLLERADPERTPVQKVRYLLQSGASLFEIDVYPFWEKQAIMEVELKSESENVTLPKEIGTVREVTGDFTYSNASLSKKVPAEDV